MGLVFRAFVSAVLSDSAMQTELGFASTLGPSLFVALIGLAAVLLSFTYMDPVTKKTTVSANMFRMGMGLVSIYGAYDFGFGHYTTYAERISRQVSYSFQYYGLPEFFSACPRFIPEFLQSPYIL